MEEAARPGAGTMPFMSDSAAAPAPQGEPQPCPPEPPPAPAQRKRRWPAILWLCAPFAALLLWWIFSALQPLVLAALPYTQAVAFASIGIVGLLYKDKYSHPFAARVALSMFVMFGALMALNTYRDREASRQDKKKNTEDFNGVNGRIDGMKKDLGDRVDKANTSVGALTGEFTDFKDKVRPDELKTEMAGLRDSMHKILNPPKATLGFTFTPFFNPPDDDKRGPIAMKEISRVMDANRVVTFDITAVNYSPSATAINTDLTLIICDSCAFAKEPKGFTKLQGNPENFRYMKVPLFNPKTSMPDVTVDVTVPPGVDSFQVGFDYRCAACVLTKGADLGIVRITNRR
jgi:hypothetical protein